MGMRSDYLNKNDERKYSQHEQYNPQHEKKSGISNLKINVTTLKKMIFVGGFVLVGTIAGKAMFDSIIEQDNIRFEQEGDYIRQEVINLTGETPEEIMERGKSR